jgi:tyrosine-protein phosphatase YwqE
MIRQHMQMRGHKVLLAHPERSPAVQRDPAVLKAYLGEGDR